MSLIYNPNGEAILVIDGALPTEAEWDEGFAANCVVSVRRMPNSARSLAALMPVAGKITALIVISASCSDLSLVDNMPNLRRLWAEGYITETPKLEDVHLLEEYHGPLKGFEAVLEKDSIRRLRVVWPRKRPRRIKAPVEDLTITSAISLSDLEILEHPEAILRLTVHGVRELNLGAVETMEHLESLTLEDCKRLIAARSIAVAPRLERLVLEKCPIIDDVESLVALRASEVRVIDRNAFYEEFRDQVDPTRWSFPRLVPLSPPGNRG